MGNKHNTVDEIAVIGLGKLGACLAGTLANAGFSVTGVDIDEETIAKINAGQAPFSEPNLQSYIGAASELSATDSMEAVQNTDVSFIVVNTPSTEAGRYSLSYVESVCTELGEVLAEKDDYHVVVLTSTVFPGATTGRVKDWLESTSGKRAGAGFGLCYSPEFIALGDVINGLEQPDFFLIGEHSRRASDILCSIYREINDQVPIARMDPVSAEITKMAVNAYVTMKISFVNTLAEICDGIGGDVDAVTSTLGLDSRISDSYLTAGARFGGPCFPRDNTAFDRLARDAGTEALLASAADAVNDQHTQWIADTVRRVSTSNETIAILGLTYKPNTYVVEESQGVELARELADEFDLVGYDPMGLDRARKTLTEDLTYVDSASLALEHATTAVVTVPWDEFEDVDLYCGRSLALIDPWRLFDSESFGKDTSYHPVGAPDSIDTRDGPNPTGGYRE